MVRTVKASVYTIVGKMEIPDIEQLDIILEGDSLKILKVGLGHFPETVMPGEEGNFAVCGHAGSKYGVYFSYLYKLKNGQQIKVTDMNGNEFTYEGVTNRQQNVYYINNNVTSISVTAAVEDAVAGLAEQYLCYSIGDGNKTAVTTSPLTIDVSTISDLGIAEILRKKQIINDTLSMLFHEGLCKELGFNTIRKHIKVMNGKKTLRRADIVNAIV